MALCRGYGRIGLFGYDFCKPFRPNDLRHRFAALYWERDGYKDIPDWFKYYHREVVRGAVEPGLESLHYLLGLAEGMGVRVRIHGHSSVLNMDRDKFFYGYQEQPKL